MEQGVVPNLAVVEFEGCWIAKQGEIEVEAMDVELKTEVVAMDVERKNSCLE